MSTRVRKLTPKAAAAAAAKSAKLVGGPPPQDPAPPRAGVAFFANDADVAALLSNMRSATKQNYPPAAPPLKTGEVNRDEDTAAASMTAAPVGLASPAVEIEDGGRPREPCLEIGLGWTIQSVPRKQLDDGKLRVDKYYYSPSGEQFRSAVEALRFLKNVQPGEDGMAKLLAVSTDPKKRKRTKQTAKKQTASDRTQKKKRKTSTSTTKGRKLSAEDEARVDTAIATVQSAYGTGAEGNKKLAKLALKGVTMRPSGKWQAQLYYAGKSRYLGVFESKEKAALGYEVARELLSEGRECNGKRIMGKATLSTEQMNVLLGLARYAAFKAVSIADAGGAASVLAALSQKVTDI